MNYIQKNGLIAIDKSEVDAAIKAQKFIGINKNPRDEQVIISLTSFPPRIQNLKYAIYSLLNQTFPADMVILWLAYEEFPNRENDLPKDLLEMTSYGLKIEWCENLRSYKKLIPALEKYPDSLIATADDDIYYSPNWLKILYEEHLKFPQYIIAHRCHRIGIDGNGKIFPYHKWYNELISMSPIPLYENFCTSGAGVLYSKKLLHGDITNREIFDKLAPKADDIWFWAMAVLNGTKIKIPANAISNLIYIDADEQIGGETLSSTNFIGGNDLQLQNVISKYPAIVGKLLQEAAMFKPYISIIAVIKNSAELSSIFENVRSNHFADFEVIAVNIGSRLDTQNLPHNFKLINFSYGTISAARNVGFNKSNGDFVIFTDAKNFFVNGALPNIANFVNKFNADVIHFSAHFKVAENKIYYVADDEFGGGNNKFAFAPLNKQVRAINWFQGKLSRRLDTKIFKREFLTKHNFKFDENDYSEFIFSCLMAAEKYLLTSQAFLIGDD